MASLENGQGLVQSRFKKAVFCDETARNFFPGSYQSLINQSVYLPPALLLV